MKQETPDEHASKGVHGTQRSALLFLVAFFFVLNNFYLTRLLSVRSGIGLGKYRAVLLLVMMVLGGCVALYHARRPGFLRQCQVEREGVAVLAVLICATTGRALIDVIQTGHIDLIGVVPMVEGLYIAAFIGIMIRSPLIVPARVVQLITIIIFGNIAIETAFYFADLAKGISYGPFRANIGGVVINRNPSFFYPVLALAVLRFQKMPSTLKTVYQAIFVAYVISLFYRTLYIALALPILVDFVRFGRLRPKRGSRSLLQVTATIFVVAIMLYQTNDVLTRRFDLPIVELAYRRLVSVTADYSGEVAKTSRVKMVPTLLAETALTPFGKGFNKEIDGSQIYNYAIYPLHPILYLGWICFIGYLWMAARFRNLWKRSKYSMSARVSVFLLLYFAVILVLFPYMTYFTFLSAIAATLLISVRIQPAGSSAARQPSGM